MDKMLVKFQLDHPQRGLSPGVIKMCDFRKMTRYPNNRKIDAEECCESSVGSRTRRIEW